MVVKKKATKKKTATKTKKKGWFDKAKKKLKNNPERMAKHRVESANRQLKKHPYYR